MNEIEIFLTGVGLTVCISFVVVIYLKSHLKKVLNDLCGTEVRSAFWAAFSNVALMLIPLIFAMFHHPKIGESAASFFEIIEQIRWALIGLIGTVIALGVAINRFIIVLSPQKLFENKEK